MAYSNTLPLVTVSKFFLDSLKIVAASLFLALASQIYFVIPYTPVLVSFQTVALFLIGFTLGPNKAALAVLCYLAEGASGLPVFAMGQAGLATLIGPKGGYYIGFVITAFISGFARKEHSFLAVFSTFLIANAVAFLVGLSWLSLFVGSKQAILLGLCPFIVGDLLKIAATTAFVKGVGAMKI